MNRLALFLAVVFALLSAGCGPSDPLDQTVEANNQLGFDMWSNRHLGALSPTDAAHFAKALHEYRLFVVTRWTGHPPEEQARRVFDQIHGLKIRTVIAQGLLFGNQRLELLIAHDREVLGRNTHLLTTPNTPEQVRVITLTRNEIIGRLALNQREVRRNEIIIRGVSDGEYTPANDPKVKPPL